VHSLLHSYVVRVYSKKEGRREGMKEGGREKEMLEQRMKHSEKE